MRKNVFVLVMLNAIRRTDAAIVRQAFLDFVAIDLARQASLASSANSIAIVKIMEPVIRSMVRVKLKKILINVV